MLILQANVTRLQVKSDGTSERTDKFMLCDPPLPLCNSTRGIHQSNEASTKS